MRKLIGIVSLALAGCAASPQQMARQSDFEVCRYTMGGPHSQVAQYEAGRRGLDCRQYYGAINGRMAAENAATANLINSLRRPAPTIAPPISCRSYRAGNQIQTDCQ